MKIFTPFYTFKNLEKRQYLNLWSIKSYANSYATIPHNNEEITDKLYTLKMRWDNKYSIHSGLDIQKQLWNNFLSHVKKILPLNIKLY